MCGWKRGKARSQSQAPGLPAGGARSRLCVYERAPVRGGEGGGSDHGEERKPHLPEKTRQDCALFSYGCVAGSNH